MLIDNGGVDDPGMNELARLNQRENSTSTNVD